MSDALVKKTIRLPETLWQAIDRIRRESVGMIPNEAEVLRQLVNEALHHRKLARKEKRT